VGHPPVKTRALLASPLGFLIGVSLGALGGGGSILAVPVLVFVAGERPTAATSTSLVVVGVASLIGAYGHWRRGRVRVGPGVVFGLVGIAGSLAGSALNRRLDGDVLLLAFSFLILVAAWRIVVGCPSCTRSGEAEAVATPVPAGTVVTRVRPWAPARVAKIVGAGTVVGFLTGLFGVGGGFVIVPALALVLEVPMGAAVGTSLLVITINTAVALAARAGSGTIDWGTTIVFTLAAVAGVGTGKRVADRLPAQATQRAFAVLLVVLAVYTGTRSALAVF
jgi:uncharacterized membrane protein YfcA